MWSRTQKILTIGGTATTALYLYNNHNLLKTRNNIVYAEEQKKATWHPPNRQTEINKLKNTPEFDLLIVGAGATGAGVALDAATRGLNVAVVDRDDFASGMIYTSF